MLSGQTFHFRRQRRQSFIQQAGIIDNDVPLALVGLVDAENLRAYRRFHLVGHLGVNNIFHRAFFPVREQRFTVDALVFIADGEAILRANREPIQLVKQPVGVHLGRDDAGARFDCPVAGDQFIITNRNLYMVKDPGGGLRPTNHRRLPLGAFVAFGIEQGAFERDFPRVSEQARY